MRNGYGLLILLMAIAVGIGVAETQKPKMVGELLSAPVYSAGDTRITVTAASDGTTTARDHVLVSNDTADSALN